MKTREFIHRSLRYLQKEWNCDVDNRAVTREEVLRRTPLTEHEEYEDKDIFTPTYRIFEGHHGENGANYSAYSGF